MFRNQRIKNALKEKGISQETLAKRLGTSQAAVGKQLNKTEDIDSLHFLTVVAELTKIPLEFFIVDPVGGRSEVQEPPVSYAGELEKVKDENQKLKHEIEVLRSVIRDLSGGSGGASSGTPKKNVG
jgi:transcriptional regulator with XRE-family HTH domain